MLLCVSGSACMVWLPGTRHKGKMSGHDCKEASLCVLQFARSPARRSTTVTVCSIYPDSSQECDARTSSSVTSPSSFGCLYFLRRHGPRSFATMSSHAPSSLFSVTMSTSAFSNAYCVSVN